MPALTDRIEFAPPPPPGRLTGFILAVIAHLLLMAALTWGIQWNRQAENVAVEAELWSSVPQQAAPKLVEAPPPAPEPPQRVETPPPPPAPREADIAIERMRKASEQQRVHQQELERQKKLEAKRKQEELKREQLAEQKAAEEKRKRDDQAKLKKQRDDDAKLAKQREDNLRRMQGLAGATGPRTSTGAAQQSKGPSASYGARIQARVRPNIVFADDSAGNPTADVEVRMAPDGTITSRKVVKSSGVKAWDDAVLRALDKTEVLPRDEDGRVPPYIVITFRPRN